MTKTKQNQYVVVETHDLLLFDPENKDQLLKHKLYHTYSLEKARHDLHYFTYEDANWLSIKNPYLVHFRHGNILMHKQFNEAIFYAIMQVHGRKLEHTKTNRIYVKASVPDGKAITFRLEPKLEYALRHDQHVLHQSFSKMLKDRYIVIPASKYHNGKALMRVAKVIKVFQAPYDDTYLCTRAQFVTPELLKTNLDQCYNFLRHDYSWFSRLAIQGDLIRWQQKLLK